MSRFAATDRRALRVLSSVALVCAGLTACTTSFDSHPGATGSVPSPAMTTTAPTVAGTVSTPAKKLQSPSSPATGSSHPAAIIHPITPDALAIPAIGVTKFVDVIAKPATMAVNPMTGKTGSAYGIPPNLTQVGWWSAYTDKGKTYAAPQPGGALGNANIAVFIAHTALDDKHGVFAKLPELAVGQKIYISGQDARHQRVTLIFEMIGKAPTPKKSDEDALAKSIDNAPAATRAAFITCSGPIDWKRGHHEYNTVVFADLVAMTGA